MKKMFAIFLCAVVFLSLMGIPATAASCDMYQQVVSEKIEWLDDGSCFVITVTQTASPAVKGGTYTKSGSKTYTYKEDGNVKWKFTVHGTFSVNSGVSATCTAASYSVSDLASGWSLKTASTSRSGNTAVGDATFQYKVLLIVTKTKSCHVVLTCDSNGNLS